MLAEAPARDRLKDLRRAEQLIAAAIHDKLRDRFEFRF
jgi:hypothetical protein